MHLDFHFLPRMPLETLWNRDMYYLSIYMYVSLLYQFYAPCATVGSGRFTTIFSYSRVDQEHLEKSTKTQGYFRFLPDSDIPSLLESLVKGCRGHQCHSSTPSLQVFLNLRPQVQRTYKELTQWAQGAYYFRWGLRMTIGTCHMFARDPFKSLSIYIEFQLTLYPTYIFYLFSIK